MVNLCPGATCVVCDGPVPPSRQGRRGYSHRPRASCADPICYHQMRSYLSTITGRRKGRAARAAKPPATRTCRRCERTLPLDTDHFYRAVRHGVQSFEYRCKRCRLDDGARLRARKRAATEPTTRTAEQVAEDRRTAAKTRLPAYPVRRLVAEVDRQVRAEYVHGYTGDGAPIMTPERLGLHERHVYAIRYGERESIHVDELDRLLIARGLNWFDVYNEDTCRRPLLSVVTYRAAKVRNDSVGRDRKPFRCRTQAEAVRFTSCPWLHGWRDRGTIGVTGVVERRDGTWGVTRTRGERELVRSREDRYGDAGVDHDTLREARLIMEGVPEDLQ